MPAGQPLKEKNLPLPHKADCAGDAAPWGGPHCHTISQEDHPSRALCVFNLSLRLSKITAGTTFSRETTSIQVLSMLERTDIANDDLLTDAHVQTSAHTER